MYLLVYHPSNTRKARDLLAGGSKHRKIQKFLDHSLFSFVSKRAPSYVVLVCFFLLDFFVFYVRSPILLGSERKTWPY